MRMMMKNELANVRIELYEKESTESGDEIEWMEWLEILVEKGR